jgi:hypothetical protein
VALAYRDYVKGISTLTPDEQLRLLDVITAHLRKAVEQGAKKHSILTLEGLGAEIWHELDSDEYIQRERESWE